MKRTQEEILKRFNNVDDFLGIQKLDLLDFMKFETAIPLLEDDFVKQVKAGKEKWGRCKNAKKQILNYLDFAYEKAEDMRGISASRSMLHFKTWIWIDDDKFYNEIVDSIDNYSNYGLSVLDKISDHYGFKRK